MKAAAIMGTVSRQAGFTLVEMAVVLVILGLLLTGLLLPLGAQMDLRRAEETQRVLRAAEEALTGYAIVNGRLPCPASSTSNGAESFAAGGDASNGNCSNFNDGFLPAVTLGLSPVDDQGYMLDGWGLTQNRVHYAVSSANTNAFTKTSGMQSIGMSTLAPNLYVCASATGITATTCGSTSNTLASNAVAVIYSLGKNAPTGGSGTDESANPNPNSVNNDSVFVSHQSTASGAANGEFDDLVIWISSNVLFNRMVAAGKLP